MSPVSSSEGKLEVGCLSWRSGRKGLESPTLAESWGCTPSGHRDRCANLVTMVNILCWAIPSVYRDFIPGACLIHIPLSENQLLGVVL